MRWQLVVGVVVLTSAGCVTRGGAAGDGGDDGTTSTGSDGPSSSGSQSTGGGSDPSAGEDNSEEAGGDIFDVSDDGGATGGDVFPGEIDLLFVIDNSGSMGEEQLNLARNLPLLIERIENLKNPHGVPLRTDVNVMVTTTDFGNPLCLPSFYSEPRDPEKGAPIASNCNDRLARFTFMSTPPVGIPEACTDVCPNRSLAPTDPFIWFSADGDNVPDVPDVDINGDGIPDGAVAQTLACLAPQGIDGCGHESPLENMLQALNPGLPWNQGAKPFMRSGSLLAIVLVTDEADCSVKNFSIMSDPQYQATDPSDGNAKPSSAICWNAGVTCNGPDAMGTYSNCRSLTDDNLQPVSRYIDYLVGELRGNQNKPIVMLGLVGVPEVTGYSPDPPFGPISGGVIDLVYRDWIDGLYPAGDILPGEYANGVTAADKQFDFGIGPGCTGADGIGGFFGQAIPPVRIKEVCEALDIPDVGTEGIRCCLDSICDRDLSGAINCLAGVMSNAIGPPT